MFRHSAEAYVVATLLLAVTTVGSAYGQGMTEVSGKYTDEANGVEITFPDGWSGFEIATGATLMAVTAPGGMSDAEVTKSITLIITEKTDRDPRDPSSFSQESIDCPSPSAKSISVAGVQGYEVTVECPSTAQTLKMVSVGTADKWIVVMYMSPTSEFTSDAGKFDAAVNSLKVQGAISSEGIPDDQMEEQPTTSMKPVMVGEESIDVSVTSSSAISEFALNEGSKMLSFKADGSGDETTVSVGKVLEGPFTVMVDGVATTDFEESTDADGVKTITLSHGTGAHEVSISGTQVVPEFPFAALGAIVAVIGVVSILGRTRLFKLVP